MPRARHLGLVALTLMLALAMPGLARAYHYEDTLRGGTTGNAEGGTFGPDGWTVNTPTDRLWFAVPTTAASGSIEFSVANITNASLFPGDNDIFNLYEAAGITEPISYGDFRANNYKTWVRLRTEPEMLGKQKLTVALCPDSATSFGDACACGTGFVEEVTGGDGNWDGSSQRLRIEWGGGHVRFLRNGVVVDDVDFTATGYGWGPREMHFSIGSTRARAVGTSGMPVGAVFSDLVVDTVDGPAASCPGAPMPVEPGMCGTELATHDTTAASWEPGVYSVPNDLNVEADGSGTAVSIAYLRFPPVGGAVTRATLTMRTNASGESAGESGRVCRVDSTTWDEATLTWSSRPTVSSTCTGIPRHVGPSTLVQWDVTSLISGTGEQSFAIVTTAADAVHYASSEAGGCDRGPRLAVELGPVSTTDAGAPPGIDAGAGSSSGSDAGVGRTDGGARSDAHDDMRARGVTGVESGCGCTAAGTPSSGPLALGLGLGVIVLLAHSRRRRWQRRRT